jgi:hypothetical protein
MTDFVRRGHQLNLSMEWYLNGCGCVGPDHNPGSLRNYRGDVAAIREHGFDGGERAFAASHQVILDCVALHPAQSNLTVVAATKT